MGSFVPKGVFPVREICCATRIREASQNRSLPRKAILLYGPSICDMRPALGHMRRIGGGGNGAAMQTGDTAGAVGALK